jgi:hypothetical protein
LNINSLIARIDELWIFISDAKIDILCVNETKLDPSINDREVYLAGYEIVRMDRNVNERNGGGGGGGCAFILLLYYNWSVPQILIQYITSGWPIHLIKFLEIFIHFLA